MVSEKTLVSNRCFLESNLKRLEEIVKQLDDETFCKDDEVARQNHTATKVLLEDTKAALKRIKEGRYGICVDCTDAISEDRLIARPEASRCVACQTKKGLRVR